MDSNFLKSCRKIKKISTKRVQGIELVCMAKLIYGAGVRKKELAALKVKDVVNEKGKIVDKIKTFDEEINLPDLVKEELFQYVDNLRERNSGQLDLEGPLFPSYACDKRIYRHLKRYLGNFHGLGRERVKSLCLEYREAGAGNEEAYRRVAYQFRLTPRRVRDIVRNIR